MKRFFGGEGAGGAYKYGMGYLRRLKEELKALPASGRAGMGGGFKD